MTEFTQNMIAAHSGICAEVEALRPTSEQVRMMEQAERLQAELAELRAAAEKIERRIARCEALARAALEQRSNVEHSCGDLTLNRKDGTIHHELNTTSEAVEP